MLPTQAQPSQTGDSKRLIPNTLTYYAPQLSEHDQLQPVPTHRPGHFFPARPYSFGHIPGAPFRDFSPPLCNVPMQSAFEGHNVADNDSESEWR